MRRQDFVDKTWKDKAACCQQLILPICKRWFIGELDKFYSWNCNFNVDGKVKMIFTACCIWEIYVLHDNCYTSKIKISFRKTSLLADRHPEDVILRKQELRRCACMSGFLGELRACYTVLISESGTKLSTFGHASSRRSPVHIRIVVCPRRAQSTPSALYTPEICCDVTVMIYLLWF